MFDQNISCLPPSLTTLEFGENFNSLPFPLPPNLINLKFGRKFNQNLEYIPSFLRKLQFLGSFDHPLPNLPSTLTKLKISGSFSFPLPPLPRSLSQLTINSDYHPINAKNTSLTKVKISNGEQYSPISLPSTVTQLNLAYWYPEFLITLPHSIRKLDITRTRTGDFSLPGLVYLKITNLPIPITALPPTIKKLCISYGNGTIFTLPSSLLHLHLYSATSRQVNFSSNLQTLVYHSRINTEPLNLPASLTKLVLKNYDRPLDNLPPSLTKLSIGKNFSHSLNNLPNSIKVLEVSAEKLSEPITRFPASLTFLSLEESYFNSFPPLPSTLTHLYLKYKLSMEDKSKIPYFPSSLETLYINPKSWLDTDVLCLPPRMKTLKLASSNKLYTINLKYFSIKVTKMFSN